MTKNFYDKLREDVRDYHQTREAVLKACKDSQIDLTGIDMNELLIGIQIEYEHGSKWGKDVNVTKDQLVPTIQIAVAHLREAPKYYTHLANMEHEAEKDVKEVRYVISGAILGALENAETFPLQIEETYPNDPWLASVGTSRSLNQEEYDRFVDAYKLDPDKKGLPFYFLVSKNGKEAEVVWQGRTESMPIEKAKTFVKDMGLPSRNYDFKWMKKPIKEAKETFTNWVMPSSEDLKLEYAVEYKHHIQPEFGDIFPTEALFVQAAQNGRIQSITPQEDTYILNRSHAKTREQLIQLIRSYRSYPKFRNETTVDAVYQGFRENKEMKLPILLHFTTDNFMWCMSGNTRMDIAFQLGINPKVVIIDVK